jgi:hypothetical protein
MSTRTIPVPASDASAERHAWIDNLRISVIVGVIGAHVALIYALDVGWYYQERTASTAAKAVLAAVFSPGLLFGMGLLFFVAGLCTPRALARKGAGRFARERLRRLGLPVLAYVVVVNPAMNFFGDRAMGQGESIGDYFRRTLRDDIELGVAWFVAALLLFSLGLAAWRHVRPARPQDDRPLRPRDVWTAVGCIAIASFAVRLVWPFLSTGELAGANLWEYPQMLTLFVLGVLAAERGWLEGGLDPQLRRTCQRGATVSLVAAVLVAVGVTLSEDPDPFLGGWRLEAMLIPAIEGAIAVCMSLWLTDWFRRRWDRASELAHEAARASFAAYLIHAPVTVVLAALLRSVGVPAEVKFLAVFAGATAVAFGLGWLATRSRVGGRIL